MPVGDDLIQRLIDAGTPGRLVQEVALLVAKAELLDERRAKDTQRKAEKAAERAALSAEIHGTPQTRRNSPSHGGARTETPTTNSSREEEESKEERKIPPSADLPKAARGKTLCPEDYQPPERLIDLGRREGLDLPAIFRARDEMVSWSRGNGEKRLDWDAVFANWLRRNAAKARAGPGAHRAGNGTGFNGKETLGDILTAARAAVAAKGQNGRPNLELVALPAGRGGDGGIDYQAPDGVPRSAGRPESPGHDLLRRIRESGGGVH